VETQPNWTGDDLAGVKVPTWIVDADHDDAIKRKTTLFMADHIPNSGPQVSHSAFLQDPQQFNADVLHFLMHLKASEFGESSLPAGRKSKKRRNWAGQVLAGVRVNQLMYWFRSRIRSFAQLALFGLAVQMVVSFGHMHRDDLGLPPLATAHWAHFLSSAAQAVAGPAGRDQYPLSQDYCPICASMALLATGAPSLLPVVVAPPLISSIWSSPASLYLVATQAIFSFQARAPPPT
jgi:hypothetical protein